jgi:hypothetical protein
MKKTEKDDEEEWGRVLIPQSDDSDNEPWFDGSSSPESEEEEEEDTTIEPSAMGKEKELRQNALMIVNKLKLICKQRVHGRFRFPKWSPSRWSHQKERRINPYHGCMQQTYPEGTVLTQCMNTIRSPNRKIVETKRASKLPIHSRLAKRPHPAFSSVTVPRTPERNIQSHGSESVENNQDEDLDLYYKIYAKLKPEMGESNAESVKRTEVIEPEKGGSKERTTAQ